jgi:hypothetical protein
MQRGLRNTIAAIRRFRMIMINLVDRGLIAETNVTKIKQEQSRYDISLEVGDPEDMEEGLGAFLNFSVVDNRACLACVRSACRIVKASLRCPLPPAASTSFQAMALPAGIGSALTVDFIQRTGTDDMTVSTAVRMITAVIDEHLKSELEKIPYFHSWRVVACQNDLDNVPVVRVALCLKAESSIDYHLKKQIGLGFILKELIADLTCDFRSSLSLTGESEQSRAFRD